MNSLGRPQGLPLIPETVSSPEVPVTDEYDDVLGRHHEDCISSLSPKEDWILFDPGAAAHCCPLDYAPGYPLLPVGKNPPKLRSVTGKPLNIMGRKLIRYDAAGVTLFTNHYVCDVPFCIVSVARMLLQDFCTVLSKDSMKLLTPQRASVDITRHGTLLYLTPEIVPYHTDMMEVEQQLDQYMNTLDIDMSKVPELPTGVDAVEQLKALINALKPTYYHTDVWQLGEANCTLTRVHKRPRRALFTPERSDCPVPMERLNGQRTTYLDYGEGNIREMQDNFITAGLPNMVMDSYCKGRTAFQLNTVPTRRYHSKAPPENTAVPKEEPEPTEAQSSTARNPVRNSQGSPDLNTGRGRTLNQKMMTFRDVDDTEFHKVLMELFNTPETETGELRTSDCWIHMRATPSRGEGYVNPHSSCLDSISSCSVYKVRTVKRVIPSKQWNTELHKSRNSTPWDPKGKDTTDTGFVLPPSMAASGRVRPPPGLESEVTEEQTEEMKTQEKTADDDDKESLRSLERQDTDVRFPEMERIRSPKRSTEDDLDDEDTREHTRQTVALISKIPRFTFGVICTTTVDGDVPISRNEDTEEIVEELKLVEPQLDYIEDEFTEQEVIDGMQTEMQSMKSFDVYDEIPIEHCSQEDIDNALDGTCVKRRKTATKVRTHCETLKSTALSQDWLPSTAVPGSMTDGLYGIRYAVPSPDSPCNCFSLAALHSRRCQNWHALKNAETLFPNCKMPHSSYTLAEFNCYGKCGSETMEILTGLAFKGDVVTTGQTAQSMCFATSLSTAKKILDTGLIPVELFTNSQVNNWFCPRSALLRSLQIYWSGLTDTLDVQEQMALIIYNPGLERSQFVFPLWDGRKWSLIIASALLAPGGEFALVLFRLAEQTFASSTPIHARRRPPSKKELTLLIQAANRQELIKIIRTHRSRFDGIHAVTSLWRISTTPRTVPHVGRHDWERGTEKNEARTLEEIVALIDQHFEDIPPRGLSNILVALAYLDERALPHWSLALRVAVELQGQLRKRSAANAQDLSNSAWAVAKLMSLAKPGRLSDRSDLSTLLEAIAGHVCERASSLSPQGLANVSWAYATAAVPAAPANLSRLRHEEMIRSSLQDVFAAVASAAVVKLQSLPESFKVQEMSNMAWAYAKLSLTAPLLFASLAEAAAPRMKEFTSQNLCNFSWAFASLGVHDETLLQNVTGEAHERIGEFNLQGLSNLVWANAMSTNSVVGEAELLQRLSAELIERIMTLDPQQACEEGISGLVRNTLGVIWAQNFVNSDAGQRLVAKVKPRVLELGRWKDSMSNDVRRTSCTSPAAELPEVVLDLEDRLVVMKPAGWEVDQDKQQNAAASTALKLSSFMQERYPHPILSDMEANCGFLHRLDVPCSGLVVVAKTYEAYYDLLLQMNSGVMIRDYVVLCHGHISPEQDLISAPLYWAEGTHLPTLVRSYGRPAQTRVKVLAHCYQQAQPLSVLALQILTGRRHQIRAHLAFVGHPLVCDGKYANDHFVQDQKWCPRTFLHRYFLAFAPLNSRLDSDGWKSPLMEVTVPLPMDLQMVLDQLSPLEVLGHRNRSLKPIYLDSVDAPGGFGNWGYDVASYGTKQDPSDVKASMEASVQLPIALKLPSRLVEAKIKEIGHPFHAVLGYSQGASLAALVASKLCKTESGKTLQWILISGDRSFLVELGIKELIQAPSLHIADMQGRRLDLSQASMIAASHFMNPVLCATVLVGAPRVKVHKVLVTTSVLSMALTPLLAAAADVLARRLREKRGLDGVEGRDEFAAVSVKRLTKADRGFVVICGYNVVGRTICRLLDTENEAQYIVFEDDVKTAREAELAGTFSDW
eukprot:symbB.v1.2.035312.t1/scaffold4706.1/size36105/1